MTTSAVAAVSKPVQAGDARSASAAGSLHGFPSASSAVVMILLAMTAAVVWQINVFEPPGLSVIGVEHSQGSEVLVVFLLVIPAYFVDRFGDRQRTHEAQRMRVAWSPAHVGVWEWNLSSDRVAWSDTTAPAFGVSPHNAPTSGRAFFALVHPDDREALGAATDRAVASGTDLVSEFRTTPPDGVVRWIHVHARVIYGSTDKPVSLLGMNIDVSDRGALEEPLPAADRKVDRLRVLRMTMQSVEDTSNPRPADPAGRRP